MRKKFKDNRSDKKYKKDKRNHVDKFYNNKEFRDLQKSWYSKLSETGFKDIEQFEVDKPYSQDSGFLKGRNLEKEKEYCTQNPYQFYRILSIFLHSQAFCAYFPQKSHKINTFLLQNYVNGASYRDLANLVKSEILIGCDRHGKHPEYPELLKSKTPIYHRMQQIIELAMVWNEIEDIDETK